MKKVICIFMAIVAVFLFTGMAFGENPKGYTGSEVNSMVLEWLYAQDYDVYTGSGTLENGVLYTNGVLNASVFKEETGKEFTPENLEEVYKNNELYGLDLDITDTSVRIVGFIEGYDVYVMDISTNTTPLGEIDGNEYFHASIVFMVYEE